MLFRTRYSETIIISPDFFFIKYWSSKWGRGKAQESFADVRFQLVQHNIYSGDKRITAQTGGGFWSSVIILKSNRRWVRRVSGIYKFKTSSNYFENEDIFG